MSPRSRKPKPESEPSPSDDDGSAGDSLSFEDAFATAERAADRLERGELSLEQSLDEYQQGAKALSECYRILQDAERRLEVLSGADATDADGDGSRPWRAAEAAGPLAELLRRVDEDADSGEDAAPPA